MTGRATLASPVHVDVDAVPLEAFGLRDDRAPFEGTRHAHRFHQLLYAAEGALRLETDDAQWLLPPQRGAWITAGVGHRVSAMHPVALRTVYLSAMLANAPPWPCRVFAVPPLAREMIVHAMRWDHRRDADDALANAYFRALAGLATEWVEATRAFHLPVAKTPELKKATDYVLARLDRELSIEAVARAAATSVRTLTRRFADETQTTFRAFVAAARMLRAMDLLAAHEARVTDVALAVGFSSTSAFTAAFTEFAGETPTAYRARVGR